MLHNRHPSLLLAAALAVAPALATPGDEARGDGAPDAPTPAPANPGAAEELLLCNGRIRLNDGRGTVVEALLVRDGVVAAAGSLVELAERAPGAPRLDLGGATAVPGLQDCHGHLEQLVLFAGTPDLAGRTDLEGVVAELVEHAAGLPEGAWILARAADLPPGTLLAADNDVLEAALPGRSVLVLDRQGHVALASDAALAAADLDPEAPMSVRARGGVAVDAKGLPTGVLLEDAVGRVRDALPREPEEARLARLYEVQESLLALGVTAVHEMGASVDFVRLLVAARDRERLRLRVVVYLDARERWTGEVLATLPLEPDPDDRLWVRGVEIVVDGVLESRGASLLEPYADQPGLTGRQRLSQDDLAREVMRAVRSGLQPAVHAVGDKANRAALDVLAGLADALPGLRELRPRIEHASVVATKDWPRFPGIGIIPSLQPSAEEWTLLEARLGAGRARSAQAWRDLAPELGRLAFGSDFPARDPDPLRVLRAARAGDGTDPGAPAGLGGAQVLAGLTSGAAWAAHQEDRRGRLSPGYRADVTVLDVDPVEARLEALESARVLFTLVDGRVVYRAAP